MAVCLNAFDEMISIPNLFRCWDQFKKGKGKSKEIQSFERHLEDHLFTLHDLLKVDNYKHGIYRKFSVSDPKRREISKASVQDRLVHHIVYSLLVTIFDAT